jgi:5-methylcytosine-specific restriction endonuclease McrA
MVTSGLEFDHIYPESKGGTSDPENLTLACRPCNRAKKDKVTDAYS